MVECTLLINIVQLKLITMNQKDRIERRRTTWNVINIKARVNQTPLHYVEAFRQIKEQDPLVEVYGKNVLAYVLCRKVNFWKMITLQNGCNCV